MKPISAKVLAQALSIMEGERYKCICAAEYIAYAASGGLHHDPDYPNLLEATNLNNRITRWVQSSLHQSRTNTPETRIELIGHFVETAKVSIGQIHTA